MRWWRIALAAVAVAATFGIGVFVGREIAKPAASRDSVTRYDLKPFSSVAPELLRYRLLATVPLELKEPRGIAVGTDGGLYACGDRALHVLDRAGTVKKRYALEGEPTCVAVGNDGRIYLGLLDHLEALDPASGRLESWPDLGRQAIVTSIAASGSWVYVADAGNREVLRFDAGGMLVGRIGENYLIPSAYFDVAAAPDGTVWTADTGRLSMRHYSPEGKLLASWGRASLDIDGFGGCCNPAQVAVLPCGSIVTSEKGLLRIKVYGPEGNLAAVVAAPQDFPASERSLDVATRKANGGEVLVLVPGERAVRIYCRKDAACDE